MKWRILKIAGVVLVVVVVVWIGSHLGFEETKIPMPLRGEAISNPFYAAMKLTDQLKAEATWERVFTVPDADSAIVLSNWNWSLSRTRRERLEKWVESGGRLVIDESLIGGSEEFEKWTGIGELKRDYDEDTDDDAGGIHRGQESDEAVEDEFIENDAVDSKPAEKQQPERRGKRPNDRERAILRKFMDDCIPLTEDVTQRAFTVCGVDTTRSLTSSRKTSWALREGGRIHALRVPVGRGSVTVLNAAPFRYRTLLEGDHARLFVRATQLHHGDSLLFLTEEDHASLLTLVWRFGAPVVLLLMLLVALALWRSSSRFGPLSATPDKSRRSLAEQIRGTGQFTLRFGAGRALHTALVRAVREAAIRRVPGYDRLSGEDRVATLARLTGVLESELGPALNYSGTRSSHELRTVIAVLETARRRLLMKKKTPT